MSRTTRIFIAMLVFVMLIIGAVGFLIGTTSGLHVVFTMANRWVPGLSIGQVTGDWRDLTVSNVRYRQPGIEVQAGKLHLSVKLSCLRARSLCVNDLALSDVNVAIDNQKMPSSPEETEQNSRPLDLSMPYPITLSRVALNNINLNIDRTTISLLDFTGGLHWQGKNLTVTPTMLNGLHVALPKASKVAQQQLIKPKVNQPNPGEAPLGETLQRLFAKPLLPDMQNVDLPLNLNITDFQARALRLTGDADVQVNRLLLKVTTEQGQTRVDALEVDSNQGMLNVTGHATLKDAWPMAFKANGMLNSGPLKGERIAISIDGALRSTLAVGAQFSGPVNMSIRGRTRLAEPGLPINLEIESQHLAWPFTGKEQFRAEGLKLGLSGKATNYRLSLNAAVQGQDLPPAVITLKAQGNERQINVDKLNVAALQGQIALKALLDWQQAISWKVDLTVNGINTARQYREWPAKLDGNVSLNGSLYGDSWQIAVPIIKLKGNIKQNAVKVNGRLEGNNYRQWNIAGLHVALGRNKLDIHGKLGVKMLDLAANIDAPALDNALPGLGGTARGTVQIRGDVNAPQLLADLTARKLRWQELQVAQVLLKGNVTSSTQIAGDLKLTMAGISQPGVDIRQVTLNAQGNEQAHQLNFAMTGEPVSGQLTLTGRFDRQQQRWQGELSRTRFNTPVGPWSLSRALSVDFRVAQQKATVGPHCWINPDAELCVPQPLDVSASGHGKINLNRFDLAILKPFLPPETQASGTFSGNADLSWDTAKPGLPQGKVMLQGHNVRITQNVNGNPLPIAFSTLNLNAELHKDRALAGWLVRLTDNGEFSGQVQVRDPQNSRALSGNVTINNFSLAMVNDIFEQGEKATGQLNANLRLAGNAERPQLFGQMRLTELNLDADFMPFTMKPSQIAVTFDGMRSRLEGQVITQRGYINLSGEAEWSQFDNWQARIAAKGDRVRIIVPPMIRLDASPDIVFDATPSMFTLSGKVDVPWARILVNALPQSAVGVSSDEVMLDSHLHPIATRSTAIPINTHLAVHVGDNVQLDAFGLRAKLTGDLNVAQDKQGLGLHGQINILNGRYHAYGQDLLVRKGEILFSGPPDQPSLNIEAIRNPEATEGNVIAGIRVTGDASEPKVDVFSIPAKSQQEALSYLLRGQGFDKSGGNSEAMTSALVGLGVAQSGQIVGKIGETFGVNNLALDTQGVGNKSQVVVSGYVLPGLQVKYGMGIFDSLANLTLRYRLMPRLYLEAVSGANQTLDLLYQFEF